MSSPQREHCPRRQNTGGAAPGPQSTQAIRHPLTSSTWTCTVSTKTIRQDYREEAAMPVLSRRELLLQSASGLALAAAGPAGGALAAMGPDDKFDLVVKGGEVLDPSQNLRARRDIGIRFGAI